MQLDKESYEQAKKQYQKDHILETSIHTKLVTSASFSPNGSQIVTCGDDGVVALWDWKNETLSLPRVLLKVKERLDACALASNSVVAVGSIISGNLYILSDSKCITVNGAHNDGDMRKYIGYIFFSPSGKYIVSGNPFNVYLWETSSGKKLWSSTSSSFHPPGFTTHEQNEFLVCGLRNGTYIVVNCRLPKKLQFTIMVPNEPEDHKYSLSTQEESQRKKRLLKENSRRVTHASWSQDGKMIAVVVDSYTYLWKVNPESLLQVGSKAKTIIKTLTSCIGVKDLAQLIYNYWRVKTPVTYLRCFGDTYNRYTDDISFSPNGERIVVSDDRAIRVYNTETGKQVCEESFDDNWNTDVEFTADGQHIVSERGIYQYHQEILKYKRGTPLWTCRDICRSVANNWLLTPLHYDTRRLSQNGICLSHIT